MDNAQFLDVRIETGTPPLIVGSSQAVETFIPSKIKDFIWCDAAEFPKMHEESSQIPLVVSWSSLAQLSELVSHGGDSGAWVLVDSMGKVAHVSALDSEFRLIAVDSFDGVPFLYLKKDPAAEELPNRVLLDAVVATASVEESRRLSRQGVIDEIAKNVATENSSAANQRATDSQLRRRIKSLLNGREKQLAARLPRPLFRVALKVWKAL